MLLLRLTDALGKALCHAFTIVDVGVEGSRGVFLLIHPVWKTLSTRVTLSKAQSVGKVFGIHTLTDDRCPCASAGGLSVS
jgi:hypothetical protein